MSMQPVSAHPARRFSFRAAAATAAAALVLLGALTVAAPAAAHDELLGTTPKADAAVASVPSEIVLTFSGVLMDEPGATEVIVTDAAGTDLTDGDPVLSGTKLTQPLTADAGTSGVVTVTWRVVSSDGHPVSDRFSFTVGADAGSVPTAVTPTGAAPSPTETAPASDQGVPPAVWIGAGVAILGALVAILSSTAAAKRRRHED